MSAVVVVAVLAALVAFETAQVGAKHPSPLLYIYLCMLFAAIATYTTFGVFTSLEFSHQLQLGSRESIYCQRLYDSQREHVIIQYSGFSWFDIIQTYL